MERYKFLKHTADIKFQAFGDSVETLFMNSFEALKECIIDDLKIKNKIKRKIKINASDMSSLLYNFLEEFLFLLEAKSFIAFKISKITVNEKKFELSAEVYGDTASNYKITNDIKAVTYNNMFIKYNKKEKKWISQVVLDA